jgi:hypothetical protein
MSNETKHELNPPCGCIFNMNCTLHKSAPDMYEALKEADAIIISLCRKLNPDHTLKQCKSCPDRKVSSILKTINKAEGKC